jgi:hypothetical protein
MDIKQYKAIISEEKGRKSIADSLLAVERTQGWQVMEMILKDRVEILQKSINDIYNTQIEEVVKKRIELYYLKELLTMPRELAGGLLREQENEHDQQVYE